MHKNWRHYHAEHLTLQLSHKLEEMWVRQFNEQIKPDSLDKHFLSDKNLILPYSQHHTVLRYLSFYQ